MRNASEMVKWIDRAIEAIDRGVVMLGLVSVSGSASLLFIGVIARYIFDRTYAVVEDLSVNLVIWAVMFFGGPVFRRGGHVSMEFFAEKLQGFKKAIQQLIICAVLLFICVIIFWKGAEIVQMIYQSGKATHSGELKEWYLKLPIPTGGALFAVYALAEMVRIICVFIDPKLSARVFSSPTQ